MNIIITLAHNAVTQLLADLPHSSPAYSALVLAVRSAEEDGDGNEDALDGDYDERNGEGEYDYPEDYGPWED